MIADQAQRELALDPRRSFIVQAPAGSGKTELLVSRYCRLLGLVGQPEEILAITFTKKAAAEMRQRVLKKLQNPEIANRLRIQTIDALCTALTRRMPVLARFGAQPEIVEDARELYKEAAGRVIGELSPPVVSMLAHLDNDVGLATALLSDMLGSRDRWLRKTGAAPTRAELEATMVAERNRLLAKACALHPKACAEFAAEMLTKEFTWRKKNAEAQGLADNEPLRQALEALCKMPPERYSDKQWSALEAILALLLPAVSHLKLVFSERGQADFTEFSHGALLALGSVDDPSELLLSLDQKISHILIDEFQDTSVSQWELLEKLTAGWTGDDPGGGDGRTLFVVGDPMQSIYRFREAEVGLFLRARHEGIGSIRLEPLTLSTNFRSQENLVSWFNGSFSRIFPAAEDEGAGAVPYSPSTANDPALPGAAVTWHGFYDREAEARKVVELLREASGKSAILIRNRSHLDHIVPALKEAGIRFRAVEIEQLGEKQVVQDLYALTRALSHPADRIAWLSILRAPWCGLTLADLLHLVAPPEMGDPSLAARSDLRTDLIWERLQNLEHLSADGRARAAQLRDTLAPVMANRLRGSLRDRVEGAWLALGGPACVEDPTELEDAEIFLDELEHLDEAGEVDMEHLARSLDQLYALPDVAAGPDAVEIMTVHKAKGLEFDTVILPGLDRAPRSSNKPLFAWKSVTTSTEVSAPLTGEAASLRRAGSSEISSLLLAPINETGTDAEPLYNYVRSLEKEAEDIEAGRLFYVAATRAESRLHLLACATCDEDNAAKPPAKRSLLNNIWFQAAEHFGAPPVEAGYRARPSAAADVLRRLPAAFALPAAPASALWRAYEQGREAHEIEFSWAGETARHVGTVVHRWLQRIAEDGLRGWDARRVELFAPQIAKELQRRGVPAGELERSSQMVVAALRNTLEDERGRWVLGPYAEARNEYRLRARSETGSRTYVMDRVFRDADGTRWVVDYKTSRHEGADIEAFLDRELERYYGQLRAYGVALGDSHQGLYFPLLRAWRQV